MGIPRELELNATNRPDGDESTPTANGFTRSTGCPSNRLDNTASKALSGQPNHCGTFPRSFKQFQMCCSGGIMAIQRPMMRLGILIGMAILD
jgi:hypothetical protein